MVQVLNLLNQPVGTVLGAFGLIYLMQADARTLFDQAAPTAD